VKALVADIPALVADVAPSWTILPTWLLFMDDPADMATPGLILGYFLFAQTRSWLSIRSNVGRGNWTTSLPSLAAVLLRQHTPSSVNCQARHSSRAGSDHGIHLLHPPPSKLHTLSSSPRDSESFHSPRVDQRVARVT
jgi:hypothetical protein